MHILIFWLFQALLVEKDHANRELQVKLENTLRTASARSNDAEALRKKLSLCEAACKAAKIKEAKLNEVCIYCRIMQIYQIH